MGPSTIWGDSMRRVWALGVVVVLGLAIALAAGAAGRADAQESSTTFLSQSQVDQCIGTVPIGIGDPPRCTFDANGNLISKSPAQSNTGPSSANLAPILFLVVIWSAVPFVIAVSMARSRNEPVSTAVLLTLVLGWIGLLIVVYGQRRTVDDVGRLVHAPSQSAGVAAPPASTAERLRTIEDLHAQGLITDEERDRRRSAILDVL